MGKVIGNRIEQKQATISDLIAQCNLTVRNMQNERTGTAHNRRMLFLNCAMALRQLVDTLDARDNQIDTLQSALDIATNTIQIPTPASAPDSGNGYTADQSMETVNEG